MKKTTISMQAGHFKAQCLKVMDEVRDKHLTIILTKHGKPVAMLCPINDAPLNTFGCLHGTIKYKKDIIEPIDVEWNANS